MLLLPLAFAWIRRAIEEQPTLTILAWLGIALVFHVAARSLYPIPLARIVSSYCTSFYTATELYSPLEFLTGFEELQHSLPFHARHNMPGKAFLYYGLRLVFPTPHAVGVGIMIFSLLAGPLAFAVARRLSGRTDVAALAMVLSCIFPARLAFAPIPNAVNPVWALLSFWIWLRYLDGRRTRDLWLLGASLYLMIFMDPLLLVIGIVFLGQLASAAHAGRVRTTDLLPIVAIPAGCFLLVHAGMRLMVGFDILSVFMTALRGAREFNTVAGRPYEVWVVANLGEFLLGVGVVPAVTMFLACVADDRGPGAARSPLRQTIRRVVGTRSRALATSTLLCLLVVDAIGVNRGEVTRLWIFLAVFVQLVCAETLVTRGSGAAPYVAIALVAVQAVLATALVGFLMC